MATNDVPFIELYNRKRSVSLSLVEIIGLVATGDNFGGSTIWKQGQYLVLYNSTFGNITCKNCDCEAASSNVAICNDTIYVECVSGVCVTYFPHYDYQSWYLVFEIQSSDNYFQGAIGAGDIASSSKFTFNHSLGYSLELVSKGLNDTNIYNWQVSCYNTGTPGAAPILTSDCDNTCILAKCEAYGVQNVSVKSSKNRCKCSDEPHYYHDGCSCKPGNKCFVLFYFVFGFVLFCFSLSLHTFF